MASLFRRGKGPWVVGYIDAAGRHRERSTRTTDKRTAERIAAAIVNEIALRRGGIIDARSDRYAAEATKALQAHIDDYLAHLRHANRSPLTIRDAKAHLAWIVKDTGAARLADLTLDAVEAALGTLQVRGLSARSLNHRGGSARAFLAWAVKSQRIERNPLRFLPRHVEALDPRRPRRAISEEEVGRLLAVAEAHGRRAYYLLALLAGLRLSELRKLTWGAVDLERGVLVIDMGKAKRRDEVPLHPDLAAELAKIRPATVLPSARVFPTTPTNATRRRHFELAKIKLVDEDKRRADLHSLRSTLGTRLARAGVAPQVAQRILRHSDYRTTAKHYVRLELADAAAAVRSLPGAPAESPQTADDSARAEAS
jgi:integrase